MDNSPEQPVVKGNNIEQPVTSESRAARISNYLNSPNYLRLIRGFDPKQRGEVLGLTTEYYILHPDGKGADDFVRQLQGVDFSGMGRSAKVTRLLVDSMAKRLGINDVSTDEAKAKIFDYYIDHHVLKGVYYHGFNGAFESAILSEGLTTDDRFWNWKDLDRIREIGAKTGNAMLLGWGGINSKGKISYSSIARDSYRYAQASPEWFAQFVSEGFHIPNNPVQKEAYYRKNYQQARKNIEELCAKMQSSKPEDIQAKKAYPNISDAEKQEILDFFEKYWSLLRGQNSSPCLALIDRDIAHEPPEQYREDMRQYYGNYASYADITRSKDIYGAISLIEGGDSLHVDSQTTNNIPSHKIEVIHLPEYEQVYQ